MTQVQLDGETRVERQTCEYWDGLCGGDATHAVHVRDDRHGDEWVPACQACRDEHLEALSEDHSRPLKPGEKWVQVTGE